MRWLLVFTSVALADPCTLSREAEAEVERLFKSAGEHASMYEQCKDGDDKIVQIQVLSACQKERAIDVRYRVVTNHRLSGECSPYPECANAPPPAAGIHTVSLKLSDDGTQLAVPRKLPGVALRTALDKVHSAGCNGKKPAYVPRKVHF
jgi:hypothetical protein